jgi:hypothetical protein
MMIEPTLHQPASEIFEMLMGMLGVDPDRVIAQAFAITNAIHPATAAAPAPRKRRSTASRKQA